MIHEDPRCTGEMKIHGALRRKSSGPCNRVRMIFFAVHRGSSFLLPHAKQNNPTRILLVVGLRPEEGAAELRALRVHAERPRNSARCVSRNRRGARGFLQTCRRRDARDASERMHVHPRPELMRSTSTPPEGSRRWTVLVRRDPSGGVLLSSTDNP